VAKWEPEGAGGGCFILARVRARTVFFCALIERAEGGGIIFPFDVVKIEFLLQAA